MDHNKLIMLKQCGIFSSSSSSSDSSDNEEMNILDTVESKPKITVFVKNVVHNFSDDEVKV